MLGAIAGDIIGSVYEANPVKTMDFVLGEAAKSAAVTHNHPEGIKGAQAVAAAIFMGRRGQSKEEIRRFITGQFAYDLKPTIAQIRPGYYFDVSCQGSVPQAIIAFLDSEDVEDAIRLAISLGGDGDTQGCIAGAIAYAYYGKMAPEMEGQVRSRLPREFIAILDAFLDLYVS